MTNCSSRSNDKSSTTSGGLSNNESDSFKFKLTSSSSSSSLSGGGGVSDGGDEQCHPCYAEELFSNGVILSLDEQQAKACVCPPPDDPVFMPPPPQQPLFVNTNRNHNHHQVTVVSRCKKRKSLLDQIIGSVRKCLLMPCHCGVIISRVRDVDNIHTRAAFDQPRLSTTAATTSSAVAGNHPWIHEFENPIYEAILHCKRSSHPPPHQETSPRF